MHISQKTLALAKQYAALQYEPGYPDMNAAIRLAKVVLRAHAKLAEAQPCTMAMCPRYR